MRKYNREWLSRLCAALLLLAVLGAALAERLPARLNRGASRFEAEVAEEAGAEPTEETNEDSAEASEEKSDADFTEEPAEDSAEEAETEASARRVDPDQKMIALTFDDGPGPGTRRILAALDEADGRATFCMVGNRVEDYAETACLVAAQGSEIATHTWDHSNLTKLSGAQIRQELTESADEIERVTGVRPSLLRPPYGSVNGAVREACEELELAIAQWNVDPEDWRVRDADEIYNRIMENAKDGAIVVCHDLYAETAAAIEAAAPALAAQGYQLVTVSELLEARADGGEAGQVYYAA